MFFEISIDNALVLIQRVNINQKTQSVYTYNSVFSVD